jgi:hypothetical protein
MSPRRVAVRRVLTLAAVAWLIGGDRATAQVVRYPGVWGPGPRRTYGTYGPRMSFGEFGYRMNYGYAFGNTYGGLGSLGYGFGYGLGPQFGPGGAVIASPASVTPGTPPMSGYYPPWAVYGWTSPNPGVFPPGSPNYGRPRPAPTYPRPPR